MIPIALDPSCLLTTDADFESADHIWEVSWEFRWAYRRPEADEPFGSFRVTGSSMILAGEDGQTAVNRFRTYLDSAEDFLTITNFRLTGLKLLAKTEIKPCPARQYHLFT